MKPVSLLLICTAFTINAFSTTTDSSSYFLQQAIQFKKQGQTKEATVYFNKAVLFNQSSISIKLEYGLFLHEIKKFQLALELFKKIIERDPQNEIALLKIAEIHFALNRWSDVISYGERLQGNEKNPAVYFMLGKAYYFEEEYDLAQQVLNKLLVQDPVHEEGLALLGKVYIELSDYKQAIKMYTSALTLNPSNANMLYEFGLLHFTINKPQETVKYLEAAVQNGYKADLDFTENLGMAYLSIDIEKGVEILGMVLKKKPNNPEIQLQIAQAYYKAKNYPHAAERYSSIYKQDPSNTKALYMMGMAYQKGGNKSKGLEICEQALRIDPSLAHLKKLSY